MPIFSWSTLVFGSTATEITGSGKIHLLEDDGLVRIAQRVAGDHVLQAHRRGDVAGVYFLDLGALAGMHLQQAADALRLACGSARAPDRRN